MERGLDSCSTSQSFSGGERTSVAFILLLFAVFFSCAEFVYYAKRVNWGVHTLSKHLSIPHIGENRMCEVSNNSMHCFY